MVDLSYVIQVYLSRKENKPINDDHITLSHRIILFMQGCGCNGNKKLLRAKEIALSGKIKQDDAEYIKIMVLMYKSCCIPREYEQYKKFLKRDDDHIEDEEINF